jgi:hypothetical protein
MTNSVRVLALIILMGGLAAHGSAPTVRVSMAPNEIVNDGISKLTIDIDTPSELNGAVLEITPPVGFAVLPQNKITLPVFNGAYRETGFSLKRTGSSALIGPTKLNVRLLPDANSHLSPAFGEVQFSYKERISVCAYLAWGLLGIVVGYLIRIIIKAQQSVPAPLPAPDPNAPQPPPPGPITRFVAKYYYGVDGGLTVVLGLLALLLLLKDNHVPDTALYWYTALGAGVALGALTNSELITRVK